MIPEWWQAVLDDCKVADKVDQLTLMLDSTWRLMNQQRKGTPQHIVLQHCRIINNGSSSSSSSSSKDEKEQEERPRWDTHPLVDQKRQVYRGVKSGYALVRLISHYYYDDPKRTNPFKKPDEWWLVFRSIHEE